MGLASWPAKSLAGESAWSPRGDLLAVFRNEEAGIALAVFDTTKPADPPRELFRIPNLDPIASWSPDGRWIACMSKLRTQRFLWVIRVADGARHLAGVTDAWPFLWASDQRLVGHDSGTGRRILEFEVPHDGDSAAAVDPRPRLVHFSRRGGLDIARVTSGARVEITPLPALYRAMLVGRSPDRRRYLVHQSNYRGTDAIVDTDGNLLADLGDHLETCSITSDGRFVAGFHGVLSPGCAGNYRTAELMLMDPASRKVFPVEGAPHSIGVDCAPVGPWVALQALHGNLIVGRLHLSP